MTRNRRRVLTIAAAALLFGTMTRADTPSATPPAPRGESARVESAGPDGDQPDRTAEVQSAEYAARRTVDRVGMAPLAWIGALGAALLATGIAFRSRRHHPERG